LSWFAPGPIEGANLFFLDRADTAQKLVDSSRNQSVCLAPFHNKGKSVSNFPCHAEMMTIGIGSKKYWSVLRPAFVWPAQRRPTHKGFFRVTPPEAPSFWKRLARVVHRGYLVAVHCVVTNNVGGRETRSGLSSGKEGSGRLKFRETRPQLPCASSESERQFDMRPGLIPPSVARLIEGVGEQPWDRVLILSFLSSSRP